MVSQMRVKSGLKLNFTIKRPVFHDFDPYYFTPFLYLCLRAYDNNKANIIAVCLKTRHR
jgi:hypothetical protein